MNEYKSDYGDRDYEMSLFKITGGKVKDIVGFVSTEFGEDTPVFQINAIILEGNIRIDIEGEHDIAYIPSDEKIEFLKEDFLLAHNE